MRTTKVLRIERGFEVIGIFVNDVLIQTMKRKISGLTLNGYMS